MPGYQSISLTASALQTDEDTLLAFRDKGWVEGLERNNTVYFSSDQRYRAKYILYLLRTRRLSHDQIQLILSVQHPPYSAKDVDQILNRAIPLSSSSGDV